MGVSMKDVARMAGVSTATVSHVLNETRHVNGDTREKVLQAIRALNYNVNPIARTLRSGHSHMIGLVISDLTNLFYMDIALSIDKVLNPEGYHLIYINSDEDPAKERDNIESLLMQNVDGLIIAPTGKDCSYMQDLIGDRCPAVFFDRKPGDFPGDCILTENFDGAYGGTELLLSRGYRNIGFIGSSFTETMDERARGYRKALLDYAVEADDKLILFGSGRPLRLSEQKVGDSFKLTETLVRDRKADALFCGNALAAVGAVSYIKENRLRIPEDIALVCFDDMFWLSMSDPPLTAVDQDRLEIGRTAATVMLDRIRGNGEPFREYRIPTKLIPRSSC